MISLPDRVNAVMLIDEAVAAGAPRRRACATLGITERTYRRWRDEHGVVRGDGRPDAVRPPAANRLEEAKRAAVLDACHDPEFASRPPGQIVPVLAVR